MACIEIIGGEQMRRFNRHALEAHGLRRGMWVVFNGDIGILTECQPLTAQMMLVDERGENRLEIPVNPWLTRQAKLSEIPAPRRFDADTARRLNYQ